MCGCDAPIAVVLGTAIMFHIRLLGQTPTAKIAAITATVAAIYSALAAGTTGPAIILRAKAVGRHSYRWVHLINPNHSHPLVYVCL